MYRVSFFESSLNSSCYDGPVWMQPTRMYSSSGDSIEKNTCNKLLKVRPNYFPQDRALWNCNLSPLTNCVIRKHPSTFSYTWSISGNSMFGLDICLNLETKIILFTQLPLFIQLPFTKKIMKNDIKITLKLLLIILPTHTDCKTSVSIKTSTFRSLPESYMITCPALNLLLLLCLSFIIHGDCFPATNATNISRDFHSSPSAVYLFAL